MTFSIPFWHKLQLLIYFQFNKLTEKTTYKYIFYTKNLRQYKMNDVNDKVFAEAGICEG